MSKYKLKYGNVNESTDFDPLPEGTYNVKIERIEETKTKEKEFPMIKIRYRVQDENYKNRILFDQVVLFPGDEKGAGITKHFLHVIDEPYEGDFDVDPESWIGKELMIQIKIDKQYNNNKVVSREESGIPF